jgi:hypothetical protein
MNQDPLHEGALIFHGIGIGTVNRDMIRQRASELAAINGRMPDEASESDWDEAKRELTRQNQQDPKQELLESVPESGRWNPIPGSAGNEALVSFDDNENEDGQSIGARLFQEGVEEAGHDQMLESARTNPPETD